MRFVAWIVSVPLILAGIILAAPIALVMFASGKRDGICK